MSMSLLAIFVVASAGTAASDGVDRHVIKANGTVAAVASEHFIGVTLDYGAVWANALTVNLSSQLAHLASMTPQGKSAPPGILRIGGSAQDSILFLDPADTCPKATQEAKQAVAGIGYHCSQDKSAVAGCMTVERFRNLSIWALKANLRIVLGLNACGGRKAVNASMELSTIAGFLKGSAECSECTSALYGFELGNELDLNVYNGCDGVEPEALGNDFESLSDLVKVLWPDARARPKLAGPDIAAFTGTTVMPDEKADGSNYYTRFLAAPKLRPDTLSALTFHQYAYCNESDPKTNTVHDLQCLSKMNVAANHLHKITSAYGHNLELWAGESSNVWTGGKPNVSDVIFDAFYYAEQLQAMSSNGVATVVRQDLIGCYYELIAWPELIPRPSYWVAYLWKQLVGPLTLAYYSNPPLPNFVHATVHCRSEHRPGLVLTLINYHETDEVTVALDADFDSTAFVLGGEVYSNRTTINGKLLTLLSGGRLPEVSTLGQLLPAGTSLQLPAKSIAFLEQSDRNKICVDATAHSDQIKQKS